MTSAIAGGCAVVVALLAACSRDAPRDVGTLSDSAIATARTPAADTGARTTPSPAGVPDTTSPLDTVRFTRHGRPLVPAVFHTICEGEDCEISFDAVACNPVDLQAAPNDTARVVARVQIGDRVRVASRDLHLLEPGLVVLRRDFVLGSDDVGDGPRPRSDTLRFARGDTAFLLRYRALGEWELAHRGRRHVVAEFWAGPSGDIEHAMGGAMYEKDSSTAIALSQPTTADWWRVARTGPGGWWRADRGVGLASLDMLAKHAMTCEMLITGP